MHVEIYILQLGGNRNYVRQVNCSGPGPYAGWSVMFNRNTLYIYFVNDLQQVYFNYEILYSK